MTISFPTPHTLQCLQKGSGYLPRAMWSSVLISCLWDAGFQLTAKHLTSHWGWGRGVLWIKLPTQRGKERSCGHQPQGSWNSQAFPPARGSHIRTAKEPLPLLPENSFQVGGLFPGSAMTFLSLWHHILPSANREKVLAPCWWTMSH